MLEKMLHHKLLTEGEQGQGVVTHTHDEAAETGTNTFSVRFSVHGHVTFPDGSQGEFKSDWLSTHNVGEIHAGAIVPVRYDPSDHSKVVLDVVALEEKWQAVLAKDKAWLKESEAKRIAEADAEAARANAET